MEYLKLLEEVKKINSHKGEKCLICHSPIYKGKILKLDCSHSYHNNCLPKIKNFFICPYCSKKSIIIHKNKCSIIIKTGKNKGSVCGRTNCKIHKLKPCEKIIKTGKNKGSVCGRINCKIHKLKPCEKIIKTGKN